MPPKTFNQNGNKTQKTTNIRILIRPNPLDPKVLEVTKSSIARKKSDVVGKIVMRKNCRRC